MKDSRPIILLLLLLALSACRSGESVVRMPDGGVIESYEDRRDSVNVLYLSRLNLALARSGRLVDRAFAYTQAGSQALIPDWGMDPETGALLSDLYWHVGHIALAQRFAFETEVLCDRGHDLDMLRRLVQTNIVYGASEVALKYISELEKHPQTREWARAQRRFLGDDSAVEADPLYGPARRCVPQEDFISTVRGVDEDFKDILRANPERTQAAEYLGVYYLLDCNFEAFEAFVDEFYPSPALPELRGCFAEAACFLSELHPLYWKSHGVGEKTYKRYRDFRNRLRNGLSQEKYRDSYWYYVMKVNNGQ